MGLGLALVLGACGWAQERTLNVTLAGAGSGAVSGAGISCGDDCAERYAETTALTLTAAPASGSSFTGWGGACSGAAATCELRVDGAETVTATFELLPVPSGTALGGVAEGWTGGEATVRAEVLGPAGEEAVVVAQAPLAADGAFDLELPGGEAMGDLLYRVDSDALACEDGDGTLTLEPLPLELAGTWLEVVTGASDEAVGYLEYGTFSDAAGSYWTQLYAAEAATLTGTCTYTFEDDEGAELTFVDTYALELAPGWNDVVFSYSYDGEALWTTTIEARVAPTGGSWFYYAYDEAPPCDPEDPDCAAPLGAVNAETAKARALRPAHPLPGR